MEKSEQIPNVLRILQDLTASANTQRKNNMQLLEMMIPGLIDEGKKVPWSNTTLDIEACINLFGFMEERAGEYIKLLEVLSYTQTDGMAKRYNGNALVIDLDIFEFMFIYKEDIETLHNLINYLSTIYVKYINNKISKSKAKKEINEVMDKIVHYKNILLSLEKVLEKAVENNYYIA